MTRSDLAVIRVLYIVAAKYVGPPSDPVLNDDAVLQSGLLYRLAVVVQCLGREGSDNGIRPRQILGARTRHSRSARKGQEHRRHDTHALIKLRMSPTVWVKFMRHTILVPSARRIWILVVGWVWSTSNLVCGCAGAGRSSELAEALGMEDGPALDDISMSGTGAPSLWPLPTNPPTRRGAT